MIQMTRGDYKLEMIRPYSRMIMRSVDDQALYGSLNSKQRYIISFGFINQNKPSVATIDIWGIFLKPSNIGFPL